MNILGLLLSFSMAIYLFIYSFISELKRTNHHAPRGTTFLLSMIMAFIFSGLTYLFIR
ncbi:hypothetical protein NST63_07305 [Heyndrickxia sp. FSL W8-0496]|uniref:hypothetical protein n=1 Tax=Heyndrickxia TaxID=2837504 RepID=UPI0030FB8777